MSDDVVNCWGEGDPPMSGGAENDHVMTGGSESGSGESGSGVEVKVTVVESCGGSESEIHSEETWTCT